MGDSLKERVFREPEGASQGFVWISFAIFFFTVYLYYQGDNESRSMLGLALGVLFVLIAIPEFLPTEYRYVAGALRLATIGIAFLALLFNIVVL